MGRRYQDTVKLRGTVDQRYEAAMRRTRAALSSVERGGRGNLALRDPEFLAWVDRRIMELVVTHQSCPEAFVEPTDGRLFEVRHLSGPTNQGRTTLQLSADVPDAYVANRESEVRLFIAAERLAKGVRFRRYDDTLANETYDEAYASDYKRRGDDDWCRCYMSGEKIAREDGRPATLRNYCVDQQEVEAGKRPVAINRVTSHAQDLHDRFSNLDL